MQKGTGRLGQEKKKKHTHIKRKVWSLLRVFPVFVCLFVSCFPPFFFFLHARDNLKKKNSRKGRDEPMCTSGLLCAKRKTKKKRTIKYI